MCVALRRSCSSNRFRKSCSVNYFIVLILSKCYTFLAGKKLLKLFVPLGPFNIHCFNLFCYFRKGRVYDFTIANTKLVYIIWTWETNQTHKQTNTYRAILFCSKYYVFIKVCLKIFNVFLLLCMS